MIAKDKKYIAYQGSFFTIEWYYNATEKSEAAEYFKALSDQRKNKLSYLFLVITSTGEISNIEKFRHEGKQIYVFKTDKDRYFCFFYYENKIIVTNAYQKQSSKMPPKEFNKAISIKKDYEERIKQGTYYEKNNKKK